MAQRQIGVGLIGYGLGGRVFHAPFISAVPGLRLVSIMQRAGNAAATDYPGSRICRSVQEVLDDNSIELVVVSTPNPTHFSIAKQALEAGKHVVIDKPFAGSSEEARQLAELAQRKGLHAVPFHNRRWDGDFLTVRKVLASSDLGRLVTFESHMDRFRPVPRDSWKEIENPVNGLLFDLGPHLVDQALFLFGVPEAVTASVRFDRDRTAIEDAFDITLHYRNTDGRQMLAHCRASYLACIGAARFLLHGTHGSFEKHGVDPQEPALVGGAKVPSLDSRDEWLHEDEDNWGRLTVARDLSSPTILVEKRVKTEPGDYRGFYANVRDAILGSAPIDVTPEDGVRVLRILELARQSSEQGCTVGVDL